MSDRRNWIKQVSLGAVGIGLGQFESFANPFTEYHGADQEKLPILLRSNENAYGPSPKARLAMTKNINASNRYGWKISAALIAALAKKNKVKEDAILSGAGSTELLNLVLQHAALQPGTILLAETTYDYWTSPSEKLGLKKITVPLTTDKKNNLPAMLAAIKADTRMIYLCNPNNPTGTICDRGELGSFIQEVTQKRILMIDEAYLDFTTQLSVSSLTNENKNLIVIKTFSKMHGLAGARIGYSIAHPETINALKELKSSPDGSISIVSSAGALASLQDESFGRLVNVLNEQIKKYTIEQLKRLNIICVPSHANFLYFSLATYKKDFFRQLDKSNIQGTRIYEENGKWTRITIGTMKEMETFINAIK